MIRVAIYARVSTADQDPEAQLLRLREAVTNRGNLIYREYVDVASGANQRRPQLDAMMADAKHHRFEAIIATKLDRLARSTINLASIIATLDDLGIRLELLDQPIDTGTPHGRMTATILGAVAEFERELIRDRTRDGLAKASAHGRTGGRPRRELTNYQREKLRKILDEEPDISEYRLAAHFEGIDRKTLITLARKEGFLGQK